MENQYCEVSEKFVDAKVIRYKGLFYNGANRCAVNDVGVCVIKFSVAESADKTSSDSNMYRQKKKIET